MMANNQLLIGYLKELHVPTIRECFEDIAQTAEQESLSYECYLLELAERECEARRERRISRLLRESRLPLEKTHLLCAIGQELIMSGRRVYFTPCSFLVQGLLLAKQNLKLSRMIKRLSKYDAIIIDDIGYVQQSREEMEVLFTLLAERYERGSIMITSNLAFSKWEVIFKDPMTTAAAIDRLVHHSVILELNIKSYRVEQAQKDK